MDLQHLYLGHVAVEATLLGLVLGATLSVSLGLFTVALCHYLGVARLMLALLWASYTWMNPALDWTIPKSGVTSPVPGLAYDCSLTVSALYASPSAEPRLGRYSVGHHLIVTACVLYPRGFPRRISWRYSDKWHLNLVGIAEFITDV